jgi:GxxExxY protein
MNDLNQLSRRIIGAAIEVHRQLGPGLLEATYETCLAHELELCGLFVERQKGLPLVYKDLKLAHGYRIDLVVERAIVVEIKAVDGLAPVNEAQVLTYLKLSGLRLGLLINFNVPLLKEGIKRFVMGL